MFLQFNCITKEQSNAIIEVYTISNTEIYIILKYSIGYPHRDKQISKDRFKDLWFLVAMEVVTRF